MATAALDIASNLVPSLFDVSQGGKVDPDKSTSIRVAVGQALVERGFGGNRPTLDIYDDSTNYIGRSRGQDDKVIDTGSRYDYVFDTGDQVRNPAYLQITAGGNDAICISYLIITPPKTSQAQKFWFANTYAEKCEAIDWSYSDEHIFNGNNSDTKTQCIWIDRDQSSAGQSTQDPTVHQQTGISMRVYDLTPQKEKASVAEQYQKDKDLLCAIPRFHVWNDLTHKHTIPMYYPPLEYKGLVGEVYKDPSKVKVEGTTMGKIGPGDKIWGATTKAKRSYPVRLPRDTTAPTRTKADIQKIRVRRGLHTCLRKTNDPGYSATKICSPNGGMNCDWVDLHEGLFCDSGEKKLYRFCSEVHTTNCFDVESERLIAVEEQITNDPSRNRQTIVKRSITAKKYTNIKTLI